MVFQPCGSIKLADGYVKAFIINVEQKFFIYCMESWDLYAFTFCANAL